MNSEILKVILTAAAPISELRGAIPLAVGVFGFSPPQAYFWSVIGNFLPIVPGLLFLHYFSAALMKKSYAANRFFSWLFRYTRDRHERRFAERELRHHHFGEWAKLIALAVFVAIPFPLTGVWSGMIIAFIFGFPIKQSIAALTVGVLAAGVIVLLLTLGFAAIF